MNTSLGRLCQCTATLSEKKYPSTQPELLLALLTAVTSHPFTRLAATSKAMVSDCFQYTLSAPCLEMNCVSKFWVPRLDFSAFGNVQIWGLSTFLLQVSLCEHVCPPMLISASGTHKWQQQPEWRKHCSCILVKIHHLHLSQPQHGLL